MNNEMYGKMYGETTSVFGALCIDIGVSGCMLNFGELTFEFELS